MNGPPGTSMPAPPDPSALPLQDLATTAALSSAGSPPPAIAGHSGATASRVVASETGPDDHEEDDEDPVTDGRRNWSHDVTIKLVKIWKRVCETHPDAGRLVRMQMVYDEFQKAVDCSNRSRKAVEDKLYSIKQMYQFIIKTSSSLHKPTSKSSTNGRSTPSWFLLTKEERRVVRSLHRVRIPSISLEVFNVVDSVLNPTPLRTSGMETPVTESAPQNDENGSSATPSGSASTTVSTPTIDGTTVDTIVDNRRNWSHDVTLQLARAWREAVHGNKELRGALLSQRVYNEFMKVVGSSSRSRKAIEDKMHSMKEMYRFIRLYNAGCVGGSGKTLWFDLSKPDRRHIRYAHKIRVPNLTAEVYAELDAFMNDGVDSTDGFPVGFSRLLAAQHNLSMSTPADPLLTASSTPTESTVDPSVSVSPLDAAFTTTYEVMRRLADEESQLVSPSVPMAEASEPTYPAEPPAKRQRTEPTADHRFQELLALQQRAITERRQQHAEQMGLLMEIATMLRQQTTNPP